MQQLLRAAAEGEHEAWDDLVDLFGQRMWSVAHACGLSRADAADAVQGAWLRLLENLHTIRDPARLGAWLATVTRHEALLIGRHGDVLGTPVDCADLLSDPATRVLEEEGLDLLWQRVTSLHEPCSTMLRLLAMNVGHQQVAVRMGVPPGTVGPTRTRCLHKLRTLLLLEETRCNE
ncbi:RNA polymerase sigma factor [Nonomuraea sp. NPDC050556]|uniref:RNA polymerase sigma factor n=1 Tax=Nonomuraea sp. NPDC050556 TaxID=3364369 RepID=UPI0037B2D9AF